MMNAVCIHNFIETIIYMIDAHFKIFMLNKNYVPDVLIAVNIILIVMKMMNF